MPGNVFLTFDVEFAWRHHRAGLDRDTIYARSIEPAAAGLSYQLEMLARHRLKACFFVDPMPALVFGIAPFARIVETIRAAGQEVQLHLHPNWRGAVAGDAGAAHDGFELGDHDLETQAALIAQARALLVAAGAPDPIAFRAGSYAANDDTLRALATLGFAYDSSHHGADHPWPSAIALPPARIAPIARLGLIEVPVTMIEERPGGLRPFQICALSTREARDALAHAIRERHVATTIVAHSFELASRAGTRVNGTHRARFDALCAMLDAHRDALPTRWFADRPALACDRDDRPLAPRLVRTRWRQVEQLWSNMIEERAQ